MLTQLQRVTVTENIAMPRGCKPQGKHALINAERQARYRARHQAATVEAIMRPRRPVDRRSRPQRWREAVDVLLALQAEYAGWLAALPESLQGSPTAEALEAATDFDLTPLADIEPPRGLRPRLNPNRTTKPIRAKKPLDLNNPNQRRF